MNDAIVTGNWTTRVAISTLAVLALLMPPTTKDAEPNKQFGNDEGCGGLHAGIQAQVVDHDFPTQTGPFVQLNFVLLNDSEAAIDSNERAWILVIDGNDLSESGRIFGNGAAPLGGWGALHPGETYQFGKAFPISEYFPENRQYKVSWKGHGFQSSTIAVKAVAGP